MTRLTGIGQGCGARQLSGIFRLTAALDGLGWPSRALAATCGGLALSGLLAVSGASPVTASGVTASPEPAGARAGAARIARLVAAPGTGPQAACPAIQPGNVRCFAFVRLQYAVNRALAAGQATRPQGWTPRELEQAYGLPAGRRTYQVVAVSIAYHTPDLGSYLRTYRQQFGLPPCVQATGCLRIVDQRGKAMVTAPSGSGSGWDVEATLDVSMISAACPHCKILVVEANSPSLSDLAATEDTAARLGAQVISNSYGARESGLTQTFARSYRHAGHMIVAASGDSGFDSANFPASLATVTAVGGTMLTQAQNARGFTERAWDQPASGVGGGSGCSAYVARPSWQDSPHCPGRTVTDVSAVAAGVPIYDKAWGGWLTAAGTSVAAPLTAGIFGLAGNASHITVRYLYQHAGHLHDITHGNNVLFGTPKQACGDDYLCVAKRSYDAPTGLGTPNGLGAF